MMVGILILGAIFSLVLAGLAFTSGRKLSNIVFAGMAFCFAIWDGAIAWFISVDSVELAAVAARVYYIIAGIFVALLLYFALLYPENNKVDRKATVAIFSSSLLIVACILFFPDFIFSEISSVGGRHAVIDRPTYLIYSAYFITLFILGITIALRKYLRYKGVMKAQAGLYAIGILLTSIPGFIGNLILPYFQNYDYIWVGPVASVFFIALTSYSIIQHKMFDVRIFAARTLTYIFLVILLSSIYSLVLFSASGYVIKDYEPTKEFLLLNATIAIFFAFSYPMLRTFFNRITDRIFFRDDYQVNEVLNHLGGVVSRHIDIDSLLSNTTELLYKYLRPDFVMTIIVDRTGEVVNLKSTNPRKDYSGLIDFVGSMSQKVDQVMILDSAVDRSSLQIKARQLGIAAVVRLEASVGVIGYTVFGDKKSGSLYSNKDNDLLKILANELSLAVQNSLRFQEIRDLNMSLENKIKEATNELRASNSRLREIDATKDEFISMASHQLRTPLTSVKGYVSMLLDGDLGRITAPQRQALEEAFDSSQRMVYLISDFLNLSRLQTGNFEIDYSKISLPEMLAEEIDQLRQSAKKRDILLLYQAPEKFPVAEADETKIRQVMMNFIDNAIYYSKPIGGEILITLDADQQNVRFCVKDNGIGVPKSVQKKLFTKFFRAENARKARPDGTGIGLYMSKRVILAHGGSVIFNSQENSGSEFGFSLPIKRTKVK